jgi:1,4-dihydroxy-2-naphthoyl-CoA hydrolase
MLTPEQLNDRALPYSKLLGIEFLKTSADEVQAKMAISADHCTVPPIAHGGSIMSLTDTVGGVATFVNLPEGAVGSITIESKTNFMRATPVGGTLFATATALHKGKQSHVWQTRVEAENGKLVAITTQTQIIQYQQ